VIWGSATERVDTLLVYLLDTDFLSDTRILVREPVAPTFRTRIWRVTATEVLATVPTVVLSGPECPEDCDN
jgi:hypothetical protein